MGGRKPWWWTLAALVIAGISYYVKHHNLTSPPPARESTEAFPTDGGPVLAEPNAPVRTQPSAPPRPRTDSAARRESSDTNAALAALIRAHETNPTVVTASGTVTKLLPDDNDGDRHQRLLVRVGSADTILIAHNIDLATRIAVNEGDPIRFKGEYIWNDRGGVVHWTHHDPRRKHPAGWVEVKGIRFD